MRWSGVRIPGGSPNEKDAAMRPFWCLWRGIPRQRHQKKRIGTFTSFSFGDLVGVRTPQGFGGCALRRRLRKCGLDKERLLGFLLQQNRSSALNRTHPVGNITSLAKGAKIRPRTFASFSFGVPRLELLEPFAMHVAGRKETAHDTCCGKCGETLYVFYCEADHTLRVLFRRAGDGLWTANMQT